MESPCSAIRGGAPPWKGLRLAGMRVLVFVTDDGTAAGTGPLLFLKDFPAAAMPEHPRSLNWRYFATVEESDELLGEDRPAIRRALAWDRPYIASRLLRRLPN